MWGGPSVISGFSRTVSDHVSHISLEFFCLVLMCCALSAKHAPLIRFALHLLCCPYVFGQGNLLLFHQDNEVKRAGKNNNELAGEKRQSL